MPTKHTRENTVRERPPVTVILLNGVGSVGKGSIARALQKITREPFLHVEMDVFMAMMPAMYHDHPDGMMFNHTTKDGHPAVGITTGPVAERVLTGMRRAVAELAATGNNLIVDDVLFGNVITPYGNAVDEYNKLMAPYRFFKIGIVAPLEIIEERERNRGDRTIGLARWQYEVVHRNMAYELEVDAGSKSPEQCAAVIKATFGL